MCPSLLAYNIQYQKEIIKFNYKSFENKIYKIFNIQFPFDVVQKAWIHLDGHILVSCDFQHKFWTVATSRIENIY